MAARKKSVPVPKNPAPANAALLASLGILPEPPPVPPGPRSKAELIEATDQAASDPNDDRPVNPANPNGQTWGQLFGRKKPVIPPAVAEVAQKLVNVAAVTAVAPPSGPSDAMRAVTANLKSSPDTPEWARPSAPHLIVVARAGTGKTTTLIGGLNVIRNIDPGITPSPQQRAIWDVMLQGREKYRSIGVCAFNASIADVLRQRVPPGCDARTMNSMGFKAVRKSFKLLDGNKAVAENNGRKKAIVAELIGKDLRAVRADKELVQVLAATVDLVGKCKTNLISPAPGESWETVLTHMCRHYDIEFAGPGIRDHCFDLVPKVLERCKDVERDRYIDYDDQLWLPVVLRLKVWEYDMLVIDEWQDTNRCQHELAIMCGRRLVMCGDDRQAIYGFAGADSESMGRMYERLSKAPNGCVRLPLTVTRRCGKAIVAKAREIVPDFEAHPDNPEGEILYARFPIQVVGKNEKTVLPYEETYLPMVKDGDMVLCRANAPLVGQCLHFLKKGRKAVIQGRNIGDQLVELVDRLAAPTVLDLISRLSDWLADELRKELAERNPSESKMEQLNDRHDCIRAFADECRPDDPTAAVVSKIQSVFTDKTAGAGILFSSGHKAKGLEADRVFILEGFGRPEHKIKNAWEREQELNLKYVMGTRPKTTLVYVTGGR